MNLPKVLVIALMFLPPMSKAAEIYEHFEGPIKMVVIEGTIEKDDYFKVLDVIAFNPESFKYVFIASNGGDAIEAMKIGKLIRTLKLTTLVPDNLESIGQGVQCRAQIVKQENCTYLSACLLLYLGGIERVGDYLGVHRIFLSHNQLASLSMDEAAATSKRISRLLKEYFEEMSVPMSLLETIENIPSEDIKVLDYRYVAETLGGYSKEYEEWMLAKCGSYEKIRQKALKAKDSEEKAMLFEQAKKWAYCQETAVRIEREKSNRKIIYKIIDQTDVAILKKYPRLRDMCALDLRC